MGKPRIAYKNRSVTGRRLSLKKTAKTLVQQRRERTSAALQTRQEEIANLNAEVESSPPVLEETQEQPDLPLSEDSLNDSTRRGEVALEGRYIVDITYMLEQLHDKFDDHDPLSVCTFRDVIQTNARRYGLQTQIFFQCRVCNFEDSVWTDRKDGETMDINRSAVAGTYTTGIGFSQLEELLASMSIPCMSLQTYRKNDMQIIAAFEKAALTEMLQAGEIAKNRALERGDFIVHDGIKIPFITVVADCAWMKRSYKTGKYDSLSGVAAIVDQHTQKVIFIGVRNKYCCICEMAARREVTPREHVCFKNWGRDQASTGMESDALVEGFNSSIEMHGLIYRTLVADGDSSVYKSIVDNHPYAKYDIMVEKKECVNHLYRNLARKITDVANTKGRNISRLKTLVRATVLKFRETIEKSVVHRQTGTVEASTTSQKIELLKSDVLNAPYHVFGDHRKCHELRGCCQQETTTEGLTVVEDLKKAGLFQQLEDAFIYLSLHADSLLYNATNNIAESYNALVCKFTGGKRINWGQRGSFQGRSNSAVLQHNTQSVLSKLHESEGKQPPSTAIALEARRQRKVRNNAERKKVRKESRALPDHQNRKQREQDHNYGPNAEKPDMPDHMYQKVAKLHQSRLIDNQTNRVDIEINTRGQADSSLWQTLRRKILTASNFGKVCRMHDTTSCSSTVQSMLYPSVKTTPAMVWGRSNEAKAIEELQNKLADEGNPVTVKPCGLFIDPELEFLGASPDGIIDATTIVEIKCPKSAQNLHPEEAIQQRVTEIPKYFDKNDPSKMNTSHHYYYQVQGQLHVTRADTCYFAVWSPLGLKYVKVPRDDAFWSDQMQPYLTRFYKECVLPEIIDGRYTRRMPIRDPKYILEARRLKSQAIETSKAGRPTQRSGAVATRDSDATPETQSTESECESENRETCGAKKVTPVRLRRQNPTDSDSWSITSSDEQTRLSQEESRVTPLKLVKRTSKCGESWIVSSSDERIGSSRNRPRIPPLKLLKRSSEHGEYWVKSSSDEQESAVRASQQSSGAVAAAPTLRSPAPTEAAKKRHDGTQWVVLSDEDPTRSPTQSEIDILESVNKTVKIDDIKRDVLLQSSLLNDSSIDQFLSVIERTTQYNTATSLWLTHLNFIKPSCTSQDIHIIGGNRFRHWRCIHFDGSHLFVYDSLGCAGYQALKAEEKRFISLRYPNLKTEDIVFPAVQRQPDSFSCGVFAAAFATTVALGGNPSQERYSQDALKLRNHLFGIIRSKELSGFPST